MKEIIRHGIRLFLLSEIMLSGCSTQLVSHPIIERSEALPPASMPYALPRAAFQLTFSVSLEECGSTPAFKVAVATVPSFEPDPGELYYVDYSALQSALKTTSLKLNINSDWTLQGLNTEFNDQTLQTVGAVLQTTAQLVGAQRVSRIGVPSLVSERYSTYAFSGVFAKESEKLAPGEKGLCTEKAWASLKKLKDAKQALQDLQSDFAKATATLAPAKKSGSGPAKKPGADGSAVAPDADDSVSAAITAATTAVSNASDALTFQLPITIRPKIADLVGGGSIDSIDTASYDVDVLSHIYGKWLTTATPSEVVVNKGAPLAGSTKVRIRFEVAGWSDRLVPANSGAPNATIQRPHDLKGVVVRQPARGLLRICLAACPNIGDFGLLTVDGNQVPYDLITPTVVVIPQFGKTVVLPLHSHLGVDATLGLTLASDGSINMISFGSTTNVAGGVSSIGNAAVAESTARANENTAIAAHNTAVGAAATEEWCFGRFTPAAVLPRDPMLRARVGGSA